MFESKVIEKNPKALEVFFFSVNNLFRFYLLVCDYIMAYYMNLSIGRAEFKIFKKFK